MANEKTPSTTPETSETAKVTPSANTENKPTEKKEKIKESGDTYFVPIYGEKPDKGNVLKILKERSTAYKECKTYEEAAKIVEKNNPDLFKRLKEKETGDGKSEEKVVEEIEKKIADKNRVEDQKNQKEIDQYLAEQGFAIDDKKKGLNTEQAVKDKEIEKKKKELMTQQSKAPEKIERKEPEKIPETKPIQEAKQEKVIEKIQEEKTEKKTSESTKKKRNLNPFKALKHVGKKGLELLAMPLHVVSKAATTISRPQDIFKRQYRKDIGTNIGRGAKSMAKTFSGLVYAPHREDTQYVNTSQSYAKTQGPTGINKPEAAITSFGWTLGKLPKLASNIVAGTTNALAETLDSIKTGKADYGDTKMAFSRASSRNPQGKSSK